VWERLYLIAPYSFRLLAAINPLDLARHPLLLLLSLVWPSYRADEGIVERKLDRLSLLDCARKTRLPGASQNRHPRRIEFLVHYFV